MAKLNLTIEDVGDQEIQFNLTGDCGNPFNEEKAAELTNAQYMGWRLLHMATQLTGSEVIEAELSEEE